MTTIKIKHFDQNVTEIHLHSVFSIFGKIEETSIIRDEEGRSQRCGYVKFSNRGAARNAVQLYNGKNILGAVPLYVAFKKPTPGGQKSYGANNIFIKNLNENIDENRLLQEFSSLGPIKTVKILRDHDNKSEGRGFLCFEKLEDATRAVLTMNGKEIDSKKIFIEFALSKNKLDIKRRSDYINKFLNSELMKGNKTINPQQTEGSLPSCSGTSSTSKELSNNSKDGANKINLKKANTEFRNLTLKSSSSSENLSDELETAARKKINDCKLSEALNNLSEEKQRKMLRELIYPQLKRLYQHDVAEKIMIVLLKLEMQELIKIFKDSSLLKAKADGIINMMKLKTEFYLSKTDGN